jgi:crotonobetainyl-CoA:carnitine CoA-transferase CaiB-like acyl-CoA transferase
LLGDVRQFGELITFSETPGAINGPPPLVGANTRDIMHELGHGDDEINTLIGDNVLYAADENYAERFTN